MNARVLARIAAAVVIVVVAVVSCQKVTLLAPSTATLTMFANPTVVALGAASTITVGVFEASGQPVPDDTRVLVSAAAGTIAPDQLSTVGGFAQTTFTAPTVSGDVVVTARSGNAPSVETTIVVGTSPGSLELAASPTQLSVGGGEVALTATLLDDADNPLSGRAVLFSSTSGSLASGGVARTTNSEGRATDVLTTSADTTVTAELVGADLTSSVMIDVIGTGAATIALTANPAALGLGGGTTSLTATALDSAGLALSGIPIVFSSDAGSLTPQGPVLTGGAGTASASLTTGQTATVTASAAGASGTVMVSVTTATSASTVISLVVSPDVINGTSTQPASVAACASATDWHLTVTATVTVNGVGVPGYRVFFDDESFGAGPPNQSQTPGAWCDYPDGVLSVATDASGIAVAHYEISPAELVTCDSIVTPCSGQVCPGFNLCCCGIRFTAELLGTSESSTFSVPIFASAGGSRVCLCNF